MLEESKGQMSGQLTSVILMHSVWKVQLFLAANVLSVCLETNLNCCYCFLCVNKLILITYINVHCTRFDLLVYGKSCSLSWCFFDRFVCL